MTNSTAYMIIGGVSAILILSLPTLVLSFRPKINLTGRTIGIFLLLCVVALTVVMVQVTLINYGDGVSNLQPHWQTIYFSFIAIYVSGLLLCAFFWFGIARHLLIFHHSTPPDQIERVLRDEGWLISRHKKLNWTILTCSKNEVTATVISARRMGSLYVRVSNSRLRSVIGHMIN